MQALDIARFVLNRSKRSLTGALLGASILLFGSAYAQHAPQSMLANAVVAPASKFEPVPAEQDNATIDDLLQDRLRKEWDKLGASMRPELLKTEANYIRTSAASSDVLWEGSFHLQPHYYLNSAAGPDKAHQANLEQPVMYYVGSVRTPLALPIVSNLSNKLNGDEASYTINLGVLPLPRGAAETDTIRYYVVIERALESNHTDNKIPFERFAKEFSVKAGEPIPLRLENEPLEKNLYIVRLENGTVLDFYDDFSRFFNEHILLNSERLRFQLGKQTMSAISSRLSIPYSVARSSQVTVELLSVVDTAHPLAIVDTIKAPADYLAELDMSSFADGPYRYRITARDMSSGKTLFTDTRDFRKSSPVMVSPQRRIGPGDTLEVGGKKTDWQAIARQLNEKYQVAIVRNDRIESSLNHVNDEKKTLEDRLKANQQTSIAGIHLRAGVGMGSSAGDNAFIGIEATRPSISLDLSFGFLYGTVPYLSYTTPKNFSEFGQSPKSVGFQFTWIPVKLLSDWFEPLVAVSYYGIWSAPSDPTGLRSASLISAQIGIAAEPLGEVHGLGFSLAYGASTGLGIGQGAVQDLSFKTYIRF